MRSTHRLPFAPETTRHPQNSGVRIAQAYKQRTPLILPNALCGLRRCPRSVVCLSDLRFNVEFSTAPPGLRTPSMIAADRPSHLRPRSAIALPPLRPCPAPPCPALPRPAQTHVTFLAISLFSNDTPLPSNPFRTTASSTFTTPTLVARRPNRSMGANTTSGLRSRE